MNILRILRRLFLPESSAFNKSATDLGLSLGPSSTSPDGSYRLMWRDRAPSGEVSGYRTEGKGSYTLFRRGRKVLEGRLERPNDGEVANNGTFVINDWLFGEGPKGTFFAFSATGEKLMSSHMTANLLNNGLSANGRYAVCQTCHAPSEDGNMLFFFDLVERKLMWGVSPKCGWAKRYRFETDRQTISLVVRDDFEYRYNFAGSFLDEAKLESDKPLRAHSGYDFYYLARERFDRLSAAQTLPAGELDQIESWVRRSLEIDKMTPRFTARPHRLLGEVLLRQGKVSEAIKELERALRLDERCGCKKLLAAAKRR